MENLTTQTAFDKLWDHFVANKGERSVLNRSSQEDPPTCMYRGENGAKCAIGVLIPDDMYKPAMEGTQFAFHLKRDLHLQEYFKEVDGRFLDLIQALHDIPKKAFKAILEGGLLAAETLSSIEIEPIPSQENFTKKMELGLRALAKAFNLAVPGEQK